MTEEVTPAMRHLIPALLALLIAVPAFAQSQTFHTGISLPDGTAISAHTWVSSDGRTSSTSVFSHSVGDCSFTCWLRLNREFEQWKLEHPPQAPTTNLRYNPVTKRVETPDGKTGVAAAIDGVCKSELAKKLLAICKPEH